MLYIYYIDKDFDTIFLFKDKRGISNQYGGSSLNVKRLHKP